MTPPANANPTASQSRTTRGLLVAVGSESLADLIGDGAQALLPLVGRPIVEQQLVQLIEAGATEVHLALFEAPRAVQERIGDGSRWGVPIVTHLVRDRRDPHAVLDRIEAADAAEWLVCDTRCLTDIPAPSDAASASVDASGRFTGTARGDAQSLRPLRFGRRTDGVATTAHWLHTASDLLASTAALLDAADSPCPFEPGGESVSIGRNVRLHPHATIHAPVVIAPNCDIGRGAVVGPNVVLGDGCVLDDGAELRDAIVADRTYIGTGLDVEQSIVRGDRLAHARLGTTLTIEDRSLIDPIRPARQRQALRQALLYLLGLAFWTLTRPLAIALDVIRWIRGREARSHFAAQFVPGLWDVVAGRRRLVGTSGQLNPLWHAPTAPAGLVTEAVVRHPQPPGPVETAVSDACYVATSSLRSDLKLVAGYARRTLTAAR